MTVLLLHLVKEKLQAIVPCNHGATGRGIRRVDAVTSKLGEHEVVLTLTPEGGVTEGLF